MEIPRAMIPGVSNSIRDAMGALCDCAAALRRVVPFASEADVQTIKRAFSLVVEAQGSLLAGEPERDKTGPLIECVQDGIAAEMPVVGGV